MKSKLDIFIIYLLITKSVHIIIIWRTIIRSIRKVLGVALEDASINAHTITGKSINALPEYFLSVKVAEILHNHFKSFTFSMEDSIPEIAVEQIKGARKSEKHRGSWMPVSKWKNRNPSKPVPETHLKKTRSGNTVPMVQ